MPLRLLILILIAGVCKDVSAQRHIQGQVIEAVSQSPVAFAHVIDNTQKGTLTNENGEFVITVARGLDQLIVSHLSYETKYIDLSDLDSDGGLIVELQLLDYRIDEIEITQAGDKTYRMLREAAKKMKQRSSEVSKTYLNVTTKSGDMPIEYLESYYNGTSNSGRVDQLEFKAGRVGLIPVVDSNRYFISLSTSKTILLLDLLERSNDFPANPLQYYTRKMKRKFDLKRANSSSAISKIYFSPKDEMSKDFSGEIWVDTSSYEIYKIILQCKDAVKYPLFPIRSFSSIEEMNFNIEINFKEDNQKVVYDYINFSYDFSFSGFSLEDKQGVRRNFKTKGLLYFYDYEDKFFIPHGDLGEEYDDYRRIAWFPYNAAFWSYNKGIKKSREQIEDLQMIKQQGRFVNFSDSYNREMDITALDGLFEDNNIAWNKDLRLALKKKIKGKPRVSLRDITTNLGSRDLANHDLKFILFFDLNEYSDTIDVVTKVYLNVFESTVLYSDDNAVHCFNNILFDLHEIYRRKFEKGIKGKSFEKHEILDQFEKTKEALETEVKKCKAACRNGFNREALRQWSDHVDGLIGRNHYSFFLEGDALK